MIHYFFHYGNYPTGSDISFQGYIGSYIETTTIGSNGQIVATFSNDAHRQLRGQTVTLTPEEVEETGNLKWNCSSSVASKYLPTSCSNDKLLTPTEPPFDPAFIANYHGGQFSYENGILKFYGTNGLMALDILESDDDGIKYAGNEFYSGISIDRDGNLILENSLNYSNEVEYNQKLYTVKSLDGLGGSIAKGSFTNSTGTYEIMYLSHRSIPDYIMGNLQNYQDLVKNIGLMMDSIINNKSPTQTEIDNYNASKVNYINFLNQQKTNGVTLSDIDNLFLKQNK